jgi:CRP/FNR family transcriptional regulator
VLEANVRTRVGDVFPTLRDPEGELPLDLIEQARYISIPSGHCIADEYSSCEQLALVLAGSVRVYKLAGSGRELTLYRITAGSSCVLTATCILSRSPFPAIAETESDVEAIAVPSLLTRRLMARSVPWSEFVFGLVSRRFGEIIEVLDGVAFQRLDHRLAAYLLSRCSGVGEIRMTHQEIASELGTSREVVTRILRAWEKAGWIRSSRARLTLSDRDALRALGVQSPAVSRDG